MLLGTGILRLMEGIYLPQTVKSTFREISSPIGNELKSTWIAGLKFVRSSESAPILIHGGSPVSCLRLLNALYAKSFREPVPVQDNHLSCSMENEK